MLWNYKEKKPFIKNRNYIKYTQNPISDAFFRWFHWKFKSKWAQLKLIVPSFLTSMIYTAIYQLEECTLYYKLFFLSFIIFSSKFAPGGLFVYWSFKLCNCYMDRISHPFPPGRKCKTEGWPTTSHLFLRGSTSLCVLWIGLGVLACLGAK